MKYSDITKVYEELSVTTKRLEKSHILSKFLKEITLAEIDDILCLLTASIFPSYDKRKIGFSDRLILKAITKTSKEIIK